MVKNPKFLHKEKDYLNISAHDINDFVDPLDNILMDVMFDHFYQRIMKNKNNSAKEVNL